MLYSGQADLLRGDWTSDISLANSIALLRNNTSSTYLYTGEPSNSLLAHAAQSAKQQIAANLGGSHVVAIHPVCGGKSILLLIEDKRLAGFPKLLSSSRL
ncbi:hypothetical protein OG21DRAFT_1488082 [Imleria badia]|nr:hypothetical protein OG21DRAFT_1488082 [Imleria badia]